MLIVPVHCKLSVCIFEYFTIRFKDRVVVQFLATAYVIIFYIRYKKVNQTTNGLVKAHLISGSSISTAVLSC